MATNDIGDDWRLRYVTVKLFGVCWRVGVNKANTKGEMIEIPTPKKDLDKIPTKMPDHKEIWPEAYNV